MSSTTSMVSINIAPLVEAMHRAKIADNISTQIHSHTRTLASESDRVALTLPTVANNEQLLCETLKNRCLEYTVDKGIVNTKLNSHHVRFSKDENGTYQMEFLGDANQDQALQFARDLNELYGRLVQQKSYENLLERAKEKGLNLQTETTQDDNSMVLTFNVEENI